MDRDRRQALAGQSRPGSWGHARRGRGADHPLVAAFRPVAGDSIPCLSNSGATTASVPGPAHGRVADDLTVVELANQRIGGEIELALAPLVTEIRKRGVWCGLTWLSSMSVTLQRHALGVTWVEQTAMARAAHGLAEDGRVWLIDPYENAEALAAVAELGTPAGVLQLLDRHNRDCELLAQRLDVPLSRLPVETHGTPFEVIPVISNRGWREIALWWANQQALVVTEAVGTAPAFALGRRVGVHPMLRLIPPRKQLLQFHPERLFVGHGGAVESGADAALRDALAQSRRDLPRLMVSIPKLLRGT